MESRFKNIVEKTQKIMSGGASLFLSLPEEIQLEILSYVPPQELIGTTSLVCRSLNVLSNDNILWQRHCDQKVLQDPVKSFKEQWIIERAKSIPNPNFFRRNQTSSQSLFAICILIGSNLSTQNELLKLYTANDNSEFKKLMCMGTFITAYQGMEGSKLNLSFEVTSEYQRTPSHLIKKAHCIFLLVNLENNSLIPTLEKLEQIKLQTNTRVAILGVYQDAQQIKIAPGPLKMTFSDLGIESCEIVNLNEPTEAKTAINNIIAELIKATANMKVSVKDQVEEPKADRSNCLMM